MSESEASQWRIADQATVTTMFKGNTLEEADGRWAVHYANDGRKVVEVRGKDTEERKWWVNDKGEFCETLYKDSSESCAPQIHINGTQTARILESSGALKWEMNVVPGNPRNL